MKHQFLAGLLALALTSPSFTIADDKPTVTAAPSKPASQNAKPAPTGFVLEDGTPMKLRLTRNLSSGSDKTGDQVDFEVLEDLSVDNVLVVPRGAVALATITEAEPK